MVEEQMAPKKACKTVDDSRHHKLLDGHDYLQIKMAETQIPEMLHKCRVIIIIMLIKKQDWPMNADRRAMVQSIGDT